MLRLLWIAALVSVSSGCERAAEAIPFTRAHDWKLQAPIAALDISKDGQAVLLGVASGESSMWTSPWNLSVPFDKVDEPLLAARFSDDGRPIFVRARGAVEVRANNGALLLDPHIRVKRPSKLASSSPNGRYVAFDSSVYDIEAMRLMVQAEPSDDQLGLAFAGDRRVLVTRAHAPQLTILRLDGRDAIERTTPDDVTAGAISNDGRLVAAGTASKVVLWDDASSTSVCDHGVKGPVAALKFSGSGRWLAAVSGKRLVILTTSKCEELASFALLDAGRLLDVDGDWVALADASGNLYVWDIYNERAVGRAKPLDQPLSHLRLHAATHSLLVAANGGASAEVALLQTR